MSRADGLRILFLTQTYPRFEGDTSGPFIRDLARALVRGGDRLTVLVPHAADLAGQWDDGGVTVRTFRYAPEAWEVVGYSRSLNKDEAVRRGAALVAPLYALGLRRAVIRALAEDRYDLVQAHWVVPNGIVAAGAVGGTPLGVGLHGSDVFLAERPGVRSLVRRTLGRCRFLTGCSAELVDRVCALGFERRAARVIPYGVDVETFRPDRQAGLAWRGRLGLTDDDVLLLGVGRMVTKKGFHHLLEAAPDLLRENPRLHVVLAGAGDRLEEYRRSLAGLGRVHFPGAVLRDTLPDLYRAADLFVLPAVHDPEGNVDGLPNVILEAMASGLPVIASGISGIPLAVTDGENGFLVTEGDADSLGDRIARLAADPDLRRRLGQASRRRAETELTWDAVAGRYRQAYTEALATRERLPTAARGSGSP